MSARGSASPSGEPKALVRGAWGLADRGMKTMKSIIASMTVATGLALAVVAPATAGDSNGNLQIKVGGTFVDFDNKTKSLTSSVAGDILAGNSAAVENTWLPTTTLTYYFNKNIAVELFCCAGGFSIVGKDGLAGFGEIGHTYTFPPVLTLQYHLDPIGGFRPYAGVGVEWIHTWGGKGSNGLGATNVKVGDFVGFALQGGVDYDLGGGWSVGVDVKKVWGNDVKVTFENVPGLGNVEAKHSIDPLFITANVGYRFNLGDLFSRRSEPAPLK